MKMNKLLQFLIFALLICGCYSTSKISNRNLSGIYNPTSNFLNPKLLVFHEIDGRSYLNFKFGNKELLYMKDNNDLFEAKFEVTLETYSSYDAKEVLDTISKTYTVNNNPADDSEIYHLIEFNNSSLATYLLKISIKDINRNNTSVSFVSVHKGNENLPQYFKTKLSDATIPLFRNHIASNEKIIIEHANPETEMLWVRYYDREFPLAAPPHSLKGTQIFSYVADSVFTVNVNSELNLTKPGIYHFQKDTLQKNGFTLFRLHNDFPNLTTANQLLEPLRYLTTKEEYSGIMSSVDKRKAIDAYWLKLAGSKERARFLIKNYYNRVQISNQFFTSYLEGWKTDRGLVYIIFGTPDGIYKSTNSEVWTYSGNNYASALGFTFNKIPNPFSENDYVLVRKVEYQFEWYKAVETWRKGRIVNL